MKYSAILTAGLLLCAQGLASASALDSLKNSGIKGGIVVHLNCGDAQETAALRLNAGYFVHGLDTSAANVAKGRAFLQAKKLYGDIALAQYDGKSLPYANNTVNLLVADSLGNVPAAEALRVLAPLGAMVVGGKQTVKPWPGNIGDWPQYLNKADNNAVAKDTVAGPPRFIQWVDNPTWCRSHMGLATLGSVVTANGRLFTIEDTATPENPFLPSAYQVVARDAFNGKKLWSRKITRWESLTMYIKCLPVQQQRRMAVAGDTLYCTLQLEGPLSALDAATGETIKVYEDVGPVQEVAFDQGIVYLNVGDRFPSAAYNIVKTKGANFVQGADPSEPFYGGGFRAGYDPEIKDKANPVSAMVALDPKTGKQLWAVRGVTNYTAATLAIKGDYAVYQTARGLCCVNAKTGQSVWTKAKAIASPVGHDSLTPGTLPNTVVLTDDKVFAAEGAPSGKVASYPKLNLVAYSLKDGKELWHAPLEGNYQSSADVCYVNGALWIGGENPAQLDVETGAVKRKIIQQMTGPMGHDRCYRNLITERFFINTKTGGADFLELATGKEFPNHWTRGSCGMGVLPANGLLYSTPFSCQCSMGVMFQGLNAYASVQPGLRRSDDPIAIQRAARLEKGPAFSETSNLKSELSENDWPAYRYDAFRSGITKSKLPATLKPVWQAKLPSQPSGLTSAGGMVFASDLNTHTIYALDQRDGKTKWTFTADARVDSPPAYYQGLVFFGGRDSWVYCLRASDGALAWRFKDLPDKFIGAYGQLESAWPICGSVLVLKDKVYFAAGRSSYLDGGIFLYALNPRTGELIKSRGCYGPFASDTGFPIGKDAGFKNDILVSDGNKLFLRHKAFTLDLAEADEGRHIIPSANFLDPQPQHRTCWALATGISAANSGDIMVSNGDEFYEVQGFPLLANHSYFDPRKNGYTLYAGKTGAAGEAKAGKGKRRFGKAGGSGEKWQTFIPITGNAMALAGDVLYVAGEPMKFADPSYKNYVAAYNGLLGGRLLAFSAATGKTLAEYQLPAAPAWDSIAIANAHLFIALKDGSIQCLGQ